MIARAAMSITIVLNLVALFAIIACSPYTLINSVAAIERPADSQGVNADELRWEIPNISNSNCPNINGTYLVHGTNIGGIGLTKPIKSFNKTTFTLYDTKLTLKSASDGISFNASNEIDDQSGQILFGKNFGCFNEQYIARSFSYSRKGGEGNNSVTLFYSEIIWSLDINQNLVVRTITRNPYWIDRKKGNPNDERVLPIRTFKRTGDAD